MSEERKNLRAFVELELDCSYYFPIFESITAILLFVALVSAIAVGNDSMLMELRPGLSWNGTMMIEHYSGFLEGSVSAYAASLSGLISILILLIPMLAGFNLAKGFEDGTLQTFLTYPITRFRILILKVGTILLLTGLPATVFSLLAVHVFIPGSMQLVPILVLSVALWIFILIVTSVAVLICIVSRRAVASAAAGMMTWSAALTLVNTPGFPQSFKGVLNPVAAVAGLLTGETSTLLTWDVAIVLMGTLLVGLVVLTLSLVAFERVEVQ